MGKTFFLTILFGAMLLGAEAQQTVTFKSLDGLEVTADEYISHTQNPYIILLHQAKSSRGEFREVAPKLINLKYNCLAVDLRSGGESNFVVNQTSAAAQAGKVPDSYADASADLRAALEYVAGRSSAPIIVLGSSYSASLALVEAASNFKIKAVVAFSPGEYFPDEQFVKKGTENLCVPILALSAVQEYNGMKEMLSHLPSQYITFFKPSNGMGAHGARALWADNPSGNEYWMALSSFFGNLKLK